MEKLVLKKRRGMMKKRLNFDCRPLVNVGHTLQLLSLIRHYHLSRFRPINHRLLSDKGKQKSE